MRWLETVWQDLRYAARVLSSNPGFAVVAILSLTLGIGANTAIFELIDAVRLRSLPVKDPQELAFVRIPDPHGRTGSFNGFYSWLTNPVWEQIRDRQQAFSSVFAFGGERLNLARGGDERNADVLWVSGEAFHTLGVPAVAGRVFTAADDQRGCQPTAMISYSFWQSEYGGDRSVIGRSLTLESHPFEIIGVSPQEFSGIEVGRKFDVAVPVCAEPIVAGEYSKLDKRATWWLGVMGRLKPGWTLKQATAQLVGISPAVFESTVPTQFQPDSAKHFLGYKLGAETAANGASRLRREYENPLWLLLAIAGLVLLVACANLANLILARATTREKEIAVRLSLGASRRRLIRQLLAESLLLAFIGAVLGVFLAQGLSRVIVPFLGTEQRRIFVDLALDWRIVGFTAGLALLTCALFGLVPAFRATQTSPLAAMNASGRGLTAGRDRFGLRRALVVLQVALSLVLVAGALLFARTLRNLVNVNPGFEPAGVMWVGVDFSKVHVPKSQRETYKSQLLERVRAVPSVGSAALTSIVPLSGSGWNQEVVLGGEHKGEVNLTRVSPGYLQTMHISLVAGRDFGPQDTATSPKVAIVNQSFAKKYFAGNALGQTFHMDVDIGQPDPVYEIVGLMNDSKYFDLREPSQPIAYLPEWQDATPDEYTSLLVRSQVSPTALNDDLRRVFHDADPQITIAFRSLQNQIRDGLQRERLTATLSGFFGLLAAILATVGLYGVIAYMVARRTNEIGIRMALGATPSSVLRLVMREALLVLAIGGAAGALLTALAGRTATSLLFGLKPWDPQTLLLAIGALGGIAMLASLVPARRAAALQPMEALREE